MDTGGSVFESVPSETELDDSYIQGKSRICKVKKMLHRVVSMFAVL